MSDADVTGLAVRDLPADEFGSRLRSGLGITVDREALGAPAAAFR